MSWEGKVKPLRARGSEINQTGCLTTTLGNILKRDFPPGENGRRNLGVAYEVSAIIKKVGSYVTMTKPAIRNKSFFS